jgi:hypothetical protein
MEGGREGGSKGGRGRVGRRKRQRCLPTCAATVTFFVFFFKREEEKRRGSVTCEHSLPPLERVPGEARKHRGFVDCLVASASEAHLPPRQP